MSKHIGNLSTSRAAKPSMLAVSTEIHFQSCFFYYCENSVFQNTIISGYNYVYVLWRCYLPTMRWAMPGGRSWDNPAHLRLEWGA